MTLLPLAVPENLCQLLTHKEYNDMVSIYTSMLSFVEEQALKGFIDLVAKEMSLILSA